MKKTMMDSYASSKKFRTHFSSNKDFKSNIFQINATVFEWYFFVFSIKKSMYAQRYGKFGRYSQFPAIPTLELNF